MEGGSAAASAVVLPRRDARLLSRPELITPPIDPKYARLVAEESARVESLLFAGQEDLDSGELDDSLLEMLASGGA